MKWYTLLPAILLPFIAQAQLIPPIRLTNSDSISYLPYNNSHSIAASGQAIHIAFTDRRDGAGEVYYKRSLDGGMTWDADRRLTVDDNIFSGRATIAVWNDEVHIVWMDRRDGNNELYYKRSTNNGDTWSNDERLTINASNSEYPSMALEFQALHLVWNDDRNGNNEIYYKRSINGGISWTADMRLTNNAGESYKPSVAVSDTIVHVLWEDLRNGASEIFYKHSFNTGMIWGNDVKLSNSISDCYAPCISANGTIAFATWDDNRTGNTEVFGRRTIDGGNSWSSEANYTNSGGDSYNAYHAFSGTYVCMIFTERNNNDPDIYYKYSTDAGLSFNGFFQAVTTNFSASEQPFLAISGAAVHFVYQDDDFGNLEILYTRNANANPFDHDHTSAWAHPISSGQTDIAYGITHDPYSNVFVTGSFSGTVDFDPGPGIYNLTSSGSTDAFVYKLNRDGELLWAKRIGGQETDIAYDIQLDSDWNVVITGSFHTIVDFDPGTGIVNIGSFGQEDVFVLKLNKEGNYVWAKRVGGGGRDEPQSIAIAESNDIYITGYFSETADFDPGPNTVNLVSQGEEDIFIFSLNEQGEYSWAKSIGGTEFDAGRSIAVDGTNHIAVTGSFRNSADFNSGNGQHIITSLGENDIFVLRMNTAGEFAWGLQFGNTGEDAGNAIIIDAAGNAYVTGYSTNTVTPQAEEDIVLYALLPDGGVRWSRRTGGNGFDAGTALALSQDDLYVAGMFEGIVDFHPGVKEIELSASGGTDIFLQKLDAADGEHRWLNQFGGSMPDVATDVVVVPFGKIGVTGYFYGIADFSPSIDQRRFISSGEEDGFVTVMRACEPSYAIVSVTVCDGFEVLTPDSIITESGIYTILMESSSGCDSIVTLHLTVLESIGTSAVEIACDTYTTPSGNHTWNETGVYTEIAMAANGCDSIIMYDLTILESSASYLETSACGVYIDPNKNQLIQSGNYEYHYINAAGCDSTFTLDLTINQMSFATIDVEACKTYTTPEGDSTWTESGVYTYTVPNATGCDSLITLELLIVDWDTSVAQAGTVLTASKTGATYQWVDCENEFEPIAEETGQSFNVLASGSYAVIIGSAECFDTSSCHTVVVVGLHDEGTLRDVIMYPNPVQHRIHLELPVALPMVDVLLTDVHGRILMSSQLSHAGSAHLDLTQPPGIYFLTLMIGKSRKIFRVVKM